MKILYPKLVCFGYHFLENLPIIDLKINFITCTSHNQGLGLEGILEADHQGLSEGIDHGEDHPDLDQLDVGSARKGLADPEKTEER